MGSILRAASCKLQAAKSQQGSSLTLWDRSCELQAARCKLQSHQKCPPDSVGSILRAASCELRACEQQKVEPRTCGVDPASCELQAASCKVTKKSSLAPVGSILRAASCKLRACEQQKSRASDLCRMTPASSYSVGGGLPSLLGSGAEERGQAIAKLRRRRAHRCCRCQFQGEGDIVWGILAGRAPAPKPRAQPRAQRMW